MQYSDNYQFYKKAIEKYGISPQGVHWNSQHNQYKRFEVLTHFIKENIKEYTILDVGCGFAEYYHYLSIHNLTPKTYLGLDCEDKMIELSKKRFPKETFYCKNVLEDKLFYADYYLCSGALNILNEEEFFNFIKICFHYSKKGFAFNFLVQDTFNPINKHKVIAFCELLAREVTTTHNYLYNDLTIFMEK